MAELFPGEDIFFAELQPGQRVVYLRKDDKGYGFTIRLRGTIVHKTPTGRYRVRLDSGRNVTVGRLSLEVEKGGTDEG